MIKTGAYLDKQHDLKVRVERLGLQLYLLKYETGKQKMVPMDKIQEMKLEPVNK